VGAARRGAHPAAHVTPAASAGAPPVSERYWTVRELAARLRVHEDTVRRWAEKGALDVVRLGPAGPGKKRRVRITEAEARKLTG
jgi:excisionase family DNA binding protein